MNLGLRLAKRVLSTDSALLRVAKRSLILQTVIDIGVSDGNWSKMALRIFPNSFYYLIEAQEEYEKISLKQTWIL